MYKWTIYLFFDIVYVRLYEYAQRRLNSYKGQENAFDKMAFLKKKKALLIQEQ